MTIKLLVVAVAKEPFIRGEPVVIKESPATWGNKEGPPNWVRVIVSDATMGQAQAYLAPMRTVFEYEVLSQDDQGKRIKISVHPGIISVFGADKGMRAELYQYLQEAYGAQNVPAQSDPPLHYVLDFPDPDLDLQVLKAEFEDEAQEALAPHRYHFSDADVDYALAHGGEVTITKAQAVTRLIDRLA
jgi:hypothetical protein